MQKLLDLRIRAAEQLKDPAHVRSAALGIFRITLQHACVALVEWLIAAIKKDPGRIAALTAVDPSKLASASDGSLIASLSELLVAAENLGWKAISRKYWEQVELPPAVSLLAGRHSANLETVLHAFVKSRNEGAEGHGLPGDYVPERDVAILRLLLDGVSLILPIAERGRDTLRLPRVGAEDGPELKTLRLIDGDPVCYRKFHPVSAGRTKVEAQVQRTLLTREDVVFEVENILLDFPRPTFPEYQIFQPSWSDSWSPFVYVPERLAAPEVFTGRTTEMTLLSDWMDDADSRKCMVWGDGGVGKTTLVVEFLQRLLEGKAKCAWKPELITFYTAKKTRWGLKGLEHISAQNVGVADVALDIARMLTVPALDRSWFVRNPMEIIGKLAGLLGQMKVSRDQHLVVLDNTETMAQSDLDVQALSEQINELSRRVGRVLLTSRRREQIEAKPIQIENWTDAEGGEFLRKRGATLKCEAIRQAGDATLRRYSRQLVSKPIALEAFVQAASGSGTALETAFQRVQKMQRQDLGQFLYDDAWMRLSQEMRRLLLLMARLGDNHDQFRMQLCCQRSGVTMASVSEAIEESRGIASISRIDGSMQLTFNPEFFNYCVERWESIDGQRVPTDEDIAWVRKRYADFMESSSAHVVDRQMRAFVVPVARAAWKSFVEGKVDQALEYYEAAVLEDPDNGWLLERFAYSLLRMRKREDALDKIRRALLVLPDDAEVHFTKGMIESRLGHVDAAISDLEKAAKLGKPKHLVELQKAYAFWNARPRLGPEARAALERAMAIAPRDRFFNRFMREGASLRGKMG